MTSATSSNTYIGRFAPSPSGRLHFGSLVAAVASYLDARAHQGQWLVRMEDIDPPREEAGAAAAILHTLEAHHLFWDQSVLYQSQRLPAYEEALIILTTDTYPCDCPRHRIRDLGGHYDNHCRHRSPKGKSALRLRTDRLSENALRKAEHFDDLFLGPHYLPLATQGDFIIRRKDQLFAYQLAVAVDDAHQQITHVIRGEDLLDSSSRQRYLLQKLQPQLPLPEYGHTPLVFGSDGHKLSKQTKAKIIANENAAANLVNALHFLGHPPPAELSSCEEILLWAQQHWQRQRVPRTVAAIKTGA